MILKYGNHTHADNEATVSQEAQSLYSQRNVKHITRRTIKIEGKIHAANVSALTTAINAMVAAYAVDGKDLGLYEDDGVTLTSHYLVSSTALGGVRVVRPPSFGNPVKGEYTTWRSYTIELEADYLALVEGLLAWQETISLVGTGGPKFVYIETLNSIPQKQQVANSTVSHMTQAGSAVGVLAYPTPPGPLYPGDEDVNARSLVKAGPLTVLGVNTDFGIKWTYKFRRAGSPMPANPTIR